MPLSISGGGTLGQRIERARVNAGMSIAELTRRAKTSKGRIYPWLNDECQPRLEQFLKLCEALSVSPNELLGWEEGE